MMLGTREQKDYEILTAEISKDREIIMDKQQAQDLIKKTFEQPFDKVRFIQFQTW